MLKYFNRGDFVLRFNSSRIFFGFTVLRDLFFAVFFVRPYRVFRINVRKSLGFRSFVRFGFYHFDNVRRAYDFISFLKRGFHVFKTLEFYTSMAFSWSYFYLQRHFECVLFNFRFTRTSSSYPLNGSF
jgi:hypothetical protein